MDYQLVKLLHILSSTLLFGTGLGTAFYMWRADVSGDLQTIANVSKNVVLADWIFTTPAVILQPVTGVIMMMQAGWPWDATWLVITYVLYCFIGCCWLPVVWLQIRVAKEAQLAIKEGRDFGRNFRRYMRLWYSLGWPAFISTIAIFYMMVAKPT